jgi:hypothetical protein
MVPVGGGGYKERVKEAEFSGNIIYVYENGKMRHVEIIPVMEGGGIKKSNGGGEFNYDIW